jgi:hypothetical protein
VRHAHVEDEAAARLGVEGIEKLLRRREVRMAQSDGIDELGNGIATPA